MSCGVELNQRGCARYFPFASPDPLAAFLHPALCPSRLTLFGLQEQVSLPSDLQTGSAHRRQEQEMGGWKELETGVSVPQLPPSCGLRLAGGVFPSCSPGPCLADLSPCDSLSRLCVVTAAIGSRHLRFPLLLAPGGLSILCWFLSTLPRPFVNRDSSRSALAVCHLLGPGPNTGDYGWSRAV